MWRRYTSVSSIVAQVHEREQHFLIGKQCAGASAADRALAFGFLVLLLVAAAHQWGQEGGQEFAQCVGFQSEQGADAVFGIAL